MTQLKKTSDCRVDKLIEIIEDLFNEKKLSKLSKKPFRGPQSDFLEDRPHIYFPGWSRLELSYEEIKKSYFNDTAHRYHLRKAIEELREIKSKNKYLPNWPEQVKDKIYALPWRLIP